MAESVDVAQQPAASESTTTRPAGRLYVFREDGTADFRAVRSIDDFGKALLDAVDGHGAGASAAFRIYRDDFGVDTFVVSASAPKTEIEVDLDFEVDPSGALLVRFNGETVKVYNASRWMEVVMASIKPVLLPGE